MYLYIVIRKILKKMILKNLKKKKWRNIFALSLEI